jgi:hypothetical protein
MARLLKRVNDEAGVIIFQLRCHGKELAADSVALYVRPIDQRNNVWRTDIPDR